MNIGVPVVMEGASNLNISNTTLSKMAMEWNIQYNPPQETQDNTIGLEGASDLDLPCINNLSQDVHAHSASETEEGVIDISFNVWLSGLILWLY